jgi:hypothetical protein
MDEKSNYTPAQAREIGFDRNAYAPADEGIFTGKLVMKIYGDFCLRCYFETANGGKIKLTAWQNRRTKRYGPRGSETDFKDVPLNTILGCRVETSRTGKLTWAATVELSR